jgi:outer membrane protein assembly factor BamB
MRTTAGVLIVVLSASVAAADDWPHWRGPHHNGISDEKGWRDTWPEEGPTVAWKASVGTGFSSVAVSQGRLYTLGNTDEKDTVACLDAVTGKAIWSHTYDAPLGMLNFEGGPTATPTVEGDKVYTLSRWGDLFCFDAASGKVRWSRNLPKETGVPVPAWGFAGSPLVYDDLLVVNVGDAGMALDKESGKEVWASANEDAGYSTPVPFRQGDEWLALFSSGQAFTAVSLRTGKQKWQVRWATNYGVNSADPVLGGDGVLVSSGYNKGAALLKMGAGEPVEVWRNKNMRSHCNPGVLLDGCLYGIDGDANGRAGLRCLDWKTGQVRWTQEDVGCGAVMAADGKLIVLSDAGELLVAKASPEGFTPSARARVLDGKCWTVPVLANGRIYCRDAAGDLVCVDVRAAKEK